MKSQGFILIKVIKFRYLHKNEMSINDKHRLVQENF